MRVSAALPTGVAALFLDSARRHRQIEALLVERLLAGDFQEVILPVVDYLEPYEAMLTNTASSWVARDELYRFVDRDGEVLALRADFTPMLARLLAPRLASLELPLQLFYRGDVLRYQEERVGRQRETYQLGAELLGLPGEAAERAALQQFLELLEVAEHRRLFVVMSFAGALDQLLLTAANGDAASDLAAAVMRRERRVARRHQEALLQVVENGVPDDPSELGEQAAERLERVTAWSREIDEAFPGIDLRVDLAEFADQALAPELQIAGGPRAYYDGLVFRAFAGDSAEPVGAGGRYDGLFHRLGAEVTAAGFSLSLDRLSGPADAAAVDAAEVTP
ncbi:MAG: ATP phosphoribosyltransferase regulatory subunit [Acidobacteriota bacterium]